MGTNNRCNTPIFSFLSLGSFDFDEAFFSPAGFFGAFFFGDSSTKKSLSSLSLIVTFLL